MVNKYNVIGQYSCCSCPLMAMEWTLLTLNIIFNYQTIESKNILWLRQQLINLLVVSVLQHNSIFEQNLVYLGTHRMT